jgi:hypothetical protein
VNRPAAILFVACLLLGGGWPRAVPGQDDEPAPDRRSPAEIAAEAFARSDWDTAAAQYRALLAQGYSDPALYYNLGTTYARAGDKGRAVWMLLKAARLSPRDASIRRNLNLVAPEVAAQVAVFPIPPVEALYRNLSLNEWALVAGALTCAAGLALFAYFWMPPLARHRPWARRAAMIAIAGAAVGHTFAAARYYDEVFVVRGVIVDADARPRAAPSEQAETYTFTLPPGTVVRLRHAGVDGWIKAVYAGRNEVFIRDGQYERL